MSNLICWCLSKSHCPPRGSWARHPLALFTELETFALHFGCGGGLCIHLTMPVWLPCFNHWSSAHHGLLSRNFQCDLPVLRWTLKLLLLLVSVMLADFNWYQLIPYGLTSVNNLPFKKGPQFLALLYTSHFISFLLQQAPQFQGLTQALELSFPWCLPQKYQP